MEKPSSPDKEAPAIPVQKSWLPGEWAPCDICREWRMIANLTSLCYGLSTSPGYERCLYICADKAACREQALERKAFAEA